MSHGRLCLSRKSNESITISVPDCEPIEVAICGVHGKRVKVVVTAPPQVRIRRSELVEEEFDLGNPIA
jgi:carbon storage regulator CsrA